MVDFVTYVCDVRFFILKSFFGTCNFLSALEVSPFYPRVRDVLQSRTNQEHLGSAGTFYLHFDWFSA